MADAARSAVKEPLIHITKRTDVSTGKQIVVRVIAIVTAFILCGLLALVLIPAIGENPAKLGTFYKCFIDGSFRSVKIIWRVLRELSVLLCIALAITPAFKMKFWNIGAEGQVLVGVLAAEGIAFKLGENLSEPLLLILMLVGAIAAGAVWGLIPALCKAQWGTNETLFTLMMNYIATFLVSFFLSLWITDGSQVMQKQAHGVLPAISGNANLPVILCVAVLTVLIFIYLSYSKHGYEISVVGESVNTAKYIGINVKKVIIRTMLLSGALCGFAGFLIGAGINQSVSPTSVGGRGFTAIMVSWLAKFSPAFMVLTSGLIVFLQRGAAEIMSVFNVSGSLADIFVGLALFFVIGCEFFLNYQLHFRKSKSEGKEKNV